MRLKDPYLSSSINQKLASFEANGFSLPGIQHNSAKDCFVKQIIDSVRRIEVVEKLGARTMSNGTQNPNNGLPFNPLKASLWYIQNGNVDEAFWLAFLAIHFGKNRRTKWELPTAIYGQLGGATFWTWDRVINNRIAFRSWLVDNADIIKSKGKFGNHRKYESLKPSLIAKPLDSYIDWIMTFGDHLTAFNHITSSCTTPRESFKAVYRAMTAVHSFGRTGKFDFLSMVGKLGLYDIEPNSTYLVEATGPIIGARILFGTTGNLSKREYEQLLDSLGDHLDLPFGMQILEDAICNWQKNITNYVYFGG